MTGAALALTAFQIDSAAAHGNRFSGNVCGSGCATVSGSSTRSSVRTFPVLATNLDGQGSATNGGYTATYPLMLNGDHFGVKAAISIGRSGHFQLHSGLDVGQGNSLAQVEIAGGRGQNYFNCRIVRAGQGQTARIKGTNHFGSNARE